MASNILFLFFLILSSFLLFILTGILFNRIGLYALLFERAAPILLLGFLLSIEILVFQYFLIQKEIVKTTWLPLKENYLKPNGRDARLDFLRGLFVAIMIVDHIGGRSILYSITFGNAFFTSAAEGFFLVSGIVTGMVYFKIIQQKGMGSAIRKSASRLLSLYLISISLSMCILFFGNLFGIWHTDGIDMARPILPLLNLLTFRTIYPLGEILIVYCVMFVLLPYVLILLESNKTIWLIGISSILYLANILFPNELLIPIDTYVKISGVQFIFIGGVIIGYHKILEKIQKKINARWLIITGLSFLFLILFWHYTRDQSIFPYLQLSDQTFTHLNNFFSKRTIAPGRILASLIVFGFLYIFLTRYWDKVIKVLGWLILPLGENALFAYTLHVILQGTEIFSVGAPEIPAYWTSGFLQVVSLLIIWVFIKKQWFTPKPQNRRLYYSLPVIIILIILTTEAIIHG
ncbi:OpgC domain-containing protein [Chloroflexota bacterium]